MLAKKIKNIGGMNANDCEIFTTTLYLVWTLRIGRAKAEMKAVNSIK